ncbi:unnamed protein product [Paramecium sonneborni]|uniref:Uncharacterized protein n=1 Tax=Paramecium sonneborni TaxID=65129 RepID=A0A8S1L8N4_9CILI|nr:unnamed protein product [Paramecium sonneborni]
MEMETKGLQKFWCVPKNIVQNKIVIKFLSTSLSLFQKFLHIILRKLIENCENLYKKLRLLHKEYTKLVRRIYIVSFGLIQKYVNIKKRI